MIIPARENIRIQWLVDQRKSPHSIDTLVKSIAWSPDAKFVATGATDKTIKIWDVCQNACVATMEGHLAEIRSVSWDPRGIWIASGGRDAMIMLWDARSFELHEILGRHLDRVDTLAWSPAGDFLASKCHNKVQVWHPPSRDPLATLPANSIFNPLAWSPDGSRLACGDHELIVWESGTWKPVQSFKMQSCTILAWTPDGKRIAVGTQDSSIQLWDVETGALLREMGLGIRNMSITGLVFSLKGDRLLSGFDESHFLHKWDLRTGEQLTDESIDLGDKYMCEGVYEMALSPHKDVIACALAADDLLLLDANTWAPLGTIRVIGLHLPTKFVAWSPAGTHLAHSNDPARDGTTPICIRETQSLREVRTLAGKQIWTIAWNPKEPQVASGSLDGSVCIWNVNTGDCVQTFKPEGNVAVCAMAWAPNGKMLALGLTSGVILRWYPGARRQLTPLKGHKAQVYSVAWHPTGDYLASGSQDGTTRVWKPTTGECVAILPQAPRTQREEVKCVAWAPSGVYLSTGGDYTICVWGVRDWKEIANTRNRLFPDINTGELDFNYMDWCPTGDVLALGSTEHAIRLWEVIGGELRLLGEIPSHAACLRVNPRDANQIAVADIRGSVYVIDRKQY